MGKQRLKRLERLIKRSPPDQCFKPELWQKVTWSRPDSPPPVLCSACSGALDRVPLRMWAEDDSAIALCGDCIRYYWVVD